MISLIIPFYNCAELAKDTVSEVLAYTEGRDMEFVAVNDGSTDGTLERLEELCEGRAKLVSYAENRGKGGAIKAGVEACSGDKIIFTDADLAYGLEIIEEFGKSLDNCHIAVGNRREDKSISRRYGYIRTMASRCFSAICQGILHLGIKDTQCGIKGYRSDVAKELFAQMTIDGFGFDLEILALGRAKGYTIEPVEVMLKTNEENSKVSIVKDGFKMIRDMVKIRRRLCQRYSQKQT